jgi:adenylyltransferase/sulfurtransferase
MDAYYARQQMLWGAEGQAALKKARVLVVGAGGLGCPALTYLTTAGVGQITLMDPDKVETSNLHRQTLYRPGDEGKYKAHLAAERLAALNPDVRIEAHVLSLSLDNAETFIADHDLVLDGTDNFGTRFLCGDVCATLNKTLVSAAIYRFEGQVGTFDGQIHYRDLYPEPPPPGSVPDCSEAGTVGAFVAVVAATQAAEALKILTGMGENLRGKLWIFDGTTFRSSILTLTPNPDNPLRAGKAINPADYDFFCGTVPEITPQILSQWKAQNVDYFLLDVRTPAEVAQKSYGGYSIPMAELENRTNELPQNRTIVVHCQTGKRSGQATALLRDRLGFKNAVNLVGTPETG